MIRRGVQRSKKEGEEGAKEMEKRGGMKRCIGK